MRREEYDAAEDDATADSFELGFQRASEESIRKRKIVKARVGSRTAVSETKSNPFGSFQGLTAEKPANPSNPFASFSGLASTTKPAVNNNSNDSRASLSYQQAIQELNKEFLAFVNGQSQKNLGVSWESAVQDYMKYAGEIATKHASTKPVSIKEANQSFSVGTSTVTTSFLPSAPSTSNTAISSGFSLDAAAPNFDKVSEFSTSNSFSFGGSATKDHQTGISAAIATPKKASSSSLFSSKPSDSEETPILAFSFGALPKPASTVSSTTGFSFSNLTAPPSNTTTSTSHYSSGVSAPSLSTNTSAAGNDDEDENTGREEATVIIKADSPDDDCKFEVKKAKIFEFKKNEKRWADKGVHPLKVLVSKKSKSARILVRNQIGKIVLNAALYKGMAVRPHEVKGKKTGVTLALQIENGELTQFLLKVNTERVDELIKALENAVS